MSKKTAVEILEIKLLGIVSFDSEVLRNKYKKQFKIAKEIQKGQTIDAFDTGRRKGDWIFDGEKYYNETYKKEEK
jgi:hypothetical protein